jgi:SSS family solute:Na+ symporter
MNNIYFQYYSLLIFVTSVVVMIAVSYATERPTETQVAGLTYATVTSDDRRATRASWNRWDVLASTFVLVLIASAYAYFRG